MSRVQVGDAVTLRPGKFQVVYDNEDGTVDMEQLAEKDAATLGDVIEFVPNHLLVRVARIP